VPVLLELFTSEGCSSCPPADRLLQILDEKQPVAGADLIVVSEHVDYWDRLGWKDPFSSPQYSARQQDYTNRYNFDGVYTPQLVVDGRYGFVGSDGREATAAIQKAIRAHKLMITISNVARSGNAVSARIELPVDENFKGTRGILYVALADNRQESHVARGENGGRTLSHASSKRSARSISTPLPARKSPFRFNPDLEMDCVSSHSSKTLSRDMCSVWRNKNSDQEVVGS
jgi:hypothetical protein